MSKIFISHSSRDNALVHRLCDWLDELGWREDYFVDYHITGGERWQESLNAALHSCKVLVVLLSRSWTESKWCFHEFQAARDQQKEIVPVLIDAEPETLLRDSGLAEFQVVDLVPEAGGTAFPSDALDELRRTLAAKAGIERRHFPWHAGRRPYVGLHAMSEDDAAVCFGRDDEIARAIRDLRRLSRQAGPHVLVIQGPSGVGKSSFLRAGIVAELRRDSREFVVVPVLRPGNDILDQRPDGLVAALEACLTPGGRRKAAIEDMVRSPQGFADLLNELEAGSRPVTRQGRPKAEPRTVVLAVDQAEELLAAGARNVERFVDALAPLVLSSETRPDASPRVLLLATVRSDSVGSLQDCDGLRSLAFHHFALGPMSATHYREVIEGPARVAGSDVSFDPELVALLIEDARGPDALPLLAMTLEWLWQRAAEQNNGLIRKADYEAVGGLSGVVNRAVEKATQGPHEHPPIPPQPDAQKALLHRIFPLIATVAEGPDLAADVSPGQAAPASNAARLITPREALRALSPEADAMVERLVRQRLLVQSGGSPDSGPATVQIAHEAAFRHWAAFQEWWKDAESTVMKLDGLRRRAADWNRDRRDSETLRERGHHLIEAEALLRDAGFGPRCGPLEREYVARCRRRQSRIRLLSSSATLVALGAVATLASALMVDHNKPSFLLRPLWLVGWNTIPEVVPASPASEMFERGCVADRDRLPGEPPCDPEYAPRSVAVGGQTACAMGKFEVTFYQYDYFVASTSGRHANAEYPPARHGRGNRPVTDVTRDKAQRYAAWLTQQTPGYRWRLPTESEWEHAARDSARTGPWAWGQDLGAATRHANCLDCTPDGKPRSNAAPLPVGSLRSNSRGLHDVAGNVAEWVMPDEGDARSGPNVVIAKGGSWSDPARPYLYVYRRFVESESFQDDSVGFRVCRETVGPQGLAAGKK